MTQNMYKNKMIRNNIIIRKNISNLLAKENGKSIAVVYCDCKTPRKARYIPYNNIKHLMVYSIIILDFDTWKDAMMDILNNDMDQCIKFFKYYGFTPEKENVWISDRWMIKD